MVRSVFERITLHILAPIESPTPEKIPAHFRLHIQILCHNNLDGKNLPEIHPFFSRKPLDEILKMHKIACGMRTGTRNTHCLLVRTKVLVSFIGV